MRGKKPPTVVKVWYRQDSNPATDPEFDRTIVVARWEKDAAVLVGRSLMRFQTEFLRLASSVHVGIAQRWGIGVYTRRNGVWKREATPLPMMKQRRTRRYIIDKNPCDSLAR